jgi:hypothetical protein
LEVSGRVSGSRLGPPPRSPCFARGWPRRRSPPWPAELKKLGEKIREEAEKKSNDSAKPQGPT